MSHKRLFAQALSELVILGSMIAASFALLETMPEEKKWLVTFDPDKYLWDTPPPDLWFAEIRPIQGYTVDDINASTFLLEGKHKPLTVSERSGYCELSFDGNTIKGELGLKISHLGIGPFRVYNTRLLISGEYTAGVKASGEGRVNIGFGFGF